MNIFEFPLNITDLSLFIGLVGAAILYFGKVIGDVKVERYDKLSFYIEGLIFFPLFILLPLSFAYYLVFIKKIVLSIFLSIFLQLLTIGCLYLNLQANFLKRFGLIKKFKELYQKKINEIKKKGKIIGEILKKKESVESKFGLDYESFVIKAVYEIPLKVFGNKKVLLFFSFLTFFSVLSIYTSNDLLSLIVSSLFTFYILTMIALSYGFSDGYLPPAVIHLKNGKTVRGKILKFGDFIYVLSGDKKIFVNKDEVQLIKESLFKKVEKNGS